MAIKRIPKRKAIVLLNALQGGVVPRVGLGYISVGREQEINALLRDIEVIENGGSTFRLISGNYGTGKTFLIQTIKEYLLDKGFVTCDCDLSPERCFIGTNGKNKGLATFQKLVSNISIKTCPEGGALQYILDDFISKIVMDEENNTSAASNINSKESARKSFQKFLIPFRTKVHGIEFTNILLRYYDAYQSNDFDEINRCLKWLKGEYRLRSEVKNDFGSSIMITDDDWFDFLDLYVTLFKIIGFKGLFIMFDEVINLFRIINPSYRLKNYEKVLNMYNDTLQGKVKNVGIILAGTPESIYDSTKGLFSYEALKSRLYFANPLQTKINPLSPIITLSPLTQSDLVVLLERLSVIHSEVTGYNNEISLEEILSFLQYVYGHSEVVATTRSIIRDFLNLLNTKNDDNSLSFEDVLKNIAPSSDIEVNYEIDN